MTAAVTVAVPVKDRRERMLRCLASLLAQDHPDYEVLVLDNESTDGTAQACRELARDSPVPVRVAVVPGRVGRVRNEGARLATGDLIAYTDSDCLAAPNWLSTGITAFEDPGVGVATGTTLPEHPPPYGPWHATMEVREQTWRFESCNVFFRREALLDVGAFPDDLGHFGEDTLAGWAMLRAGWTAAFVPDAIIYHDVTYPGKLWHLRRVQKYGKVAAVIQAYPEARDRLLWRRWFVRPRNAKFTAALAGLALGRFDRRALLLTLPYLHERGPTTLHPLGLRDAADRIAIDAAVLAGDIRGSIRWRTLVL